MAWISSAEGQRTVEDCMYQVQTESKTLHWVAEKALYNASWWRERLEHPESSSVYTDDELAQYAMQFVVARRRHKRIKNALKVLATEAVLAGVHVVDERL